MEENILKDYAEFVQSSVKTYAEAGRARKQCHSCGVYVHVRSKNCVCGHDFANNAAVELAKVLTKEQLEYRDLAISLRLRRFTPIVVPSGKCPVVFAGDISSYCQSILDYGVVERKLYTTSAMRYWLRKFVEVNSDDFQFYSDEINQWINKKIQSTESNYC